MKRIKLIILLLFCTTIALGQGQKSDKDKKETPDLPGIILVDFGFNFQKDAPSEMDINWFKSKSFGIYYMRTFELGKKLTFNPAVGINFEKYGFSNDVTIGYPTLTLAQEANPDADPPVFQAPATYGELSVIDLSNGRNVSKSQMAMNYLDIPLQLRYNFKGNDKKGGMYVAIGCMASLLLESHTKVKYKEAGRDQTIKRRDDFQQSTLRYGLQGRFGFGSFNFFYKQYFSNVFNGKGPAGTSDITTSTFGISVSGL
ncbi:MAG: outer membrane beta-barrel protein [Cyclobacteriaceae bacterium]